MKRLRLRKLGWNIASAALAAVIGSTGLASAAPIADPADAAACAQRYARGTQAFQQCLDTRTAYRNRGGQVSSNPPGAPTISATSAETNDPPAAYFFCLSPGTSPYASTTPIKGCTTTNTLICLRKTDDGKYHCIDSNGVAADPPRGICQVNPHFACKDEAPTTPPATTTAAPANPTPRDQPPTVAPTNLATLPGTPAPTTSLTPAPDISATNPVTPSATPSTSPSTSPSTTPSTTPSSSASATAATIAPDDPVGQALTEARTHGLRIWLESDLVKAWRERRDEQAACDTEEQDKEDGCDALRAAAKRLALYARKPGVAGVKIAFDLGLRDDFAGPDEIVRFVTETSQILRPLLSSRQRIAIDVVIPELGCGSNEACRKAMRRDHPLITLANVEKYVLNGRIDAVNVSTGIPTKDYTDRYKIQTSTVINNVWTTIRRRGWKSKNPDLYIGAREIALAHSQARNRLTPDQAASLLKEFIDTPLGGGEPGTTNRMLPAAVDHVVLWTWRQQFIGRDGRKRIWRLTDAGGKTNAIWAALSKRKELRPVGIAYNPREFESSVPDDVADIAEVASSIFVFVP
ncbi:hypothetical protein [Nonomuraea jabiensis]|uniref:hypothetical protein n=1 Tax=Nonomuraea jabiensis TaxID=882448 RepID=UPI003D75FAFB